MADRLPVSLTVNGARREAEVEPRECLAELLREHLGLTGTHVGCQQGACGACTVLLDGESVRACLMLAVQADGCAVETIEGLAAPGAPLHPVQQALSEQHGLQCGFCTPGVAMTLVELFRRDPAPDATAVREALAGHHCRCTGYQGMIAAALSLTGTHAPSPTPEAHSAKRRPAR
jgi:aerobic-type carbon monoxide dehydrogenase small subunit (CoxS/CutS family)